MNFFRKLLAAFKKRPFILPPGVRHNRRAARQELERICTQSTLGLTSALSNEQKQAAGLNQRMMLEQLDRLLERHADVERIEYEVCHLDDIHRGAEMGLLQRSYVERVEGIAQHTYAVIGHCIRWQKSILPHPERNMSGSVSVLIDNSVRDFGIEKTFQQILRAEYDYRTKYVDHPSMSSPYTWTTEGTIDGRVYVHYHEVSKRALTFSPPHPDLVVNAVFKLIQSMAEKAREKVGVKDS